MENETYMTTTEAGLRFGVTSHTVVRWIRTGHLRGRRRGPGRTSGWLVPESEVRRLEAQLAGTPPQEAGHAKTQTETE